MAMGYARNSNTYTQYQSGIRRLPLRMPPHRAYDSRRSEVPALRSLQCGYGMDLCAFYEIVPPEGLIRSVVFLHPSGSSTNTPSGSWRRSLLWPTPCEVNGMPRGKVIDFFERRE